MLATPIHDMARHVITVTSGGVIVGLDLVWSRCGDSEGIGYFGAILTLGEEEDAVVL